METLLEQTGVMQAVSRILSMNVQPLVNSVISSAQMELLILLRPVTTETLLELTGVMLVV
jgi:hypothetical protein